MYSTEKDYSLSKIRQSSHYIVPTYSKPDDFVFVKGEGAYLFDSNNQRYLDFAAGIAVNALGHSNKRWIEVFFFSTNIRCVCLQLCIIFIYIDCIVTI